MFLRKTTTRILKKVTAVALTAVTAFSALALFPEEAMQKAEAFAYTSPKPIDTGYYYIKNVKSGKYMDVYGNQTGYRTKINQYPFHGAMNQRFYVEYHTDPTDGAYYTIRVLNTTDNMVFDLVSKDASMTNGTYLQTWGDCHTFVAEQRFTIKYASGETGYEIGTWASTGKKVLGVEGASLSNNALIRIWDRNGSNTSDNWYFERAPLGMSYNVLTTNISDNDITDGYNVKAYCGLLGYQSRFSNHPTKANLKTNISDSSLVVLHGHGGPGYVNIDGRGSVNSGSISNYFPTKTAEQMQLVYFASCHSADNVRDDGTYVKSLVDAVIDQGAKCAIGFENSVERAEEFALFLMQSIYENRYLTLENALKKAKKKYVDAFGNDRMYQKGGSRENLTVYNDPLSPINSNNIVIKGNQGVILDLRLP